MRLPARNYPRVADSLNHRPSLRKATTMNDPFARLPVVPNFTVTSTDVTDGQPLPPAQMSGIFQAPGGKDVSPQLSWSGAPAETKSYTVTMYDPDAPSGSGFRDRVLGVDIPASVTGLPAGAGDGRAPARRSVPYPQRRAPGPLSSSALRRRPATRVTATSSWCRPSVSRRSDSFSFGFRPTRPRPGSASASTSAAISSAVRSLPPRQRSRPHDAVGGEATVTGPNGRSECGPASSRS